MASDTASGQDTLRTERPALPVCVVIPAYNRAHQLERCLESVWAQRPFLPKEVIVVDDNSTDDTAEVAASLGARVISHAENRGAGEARNTALAATNCEWVAFLDSDDEWLPDHLAHLWDIKRDHALVGAASFHCTNDGAGDRFFGPVTRKPMQFQSPDRLISSYNFFTASGSMLRRDVAIAVGGFHDWWGVADIDLSVRVLERHTGTCSRRVTVRYHIHDDQMSLAKDRMLAEHREVIKAHLKRTGRNRDMLERWEAGLAWDALRAELADGHPRAALRHLPGVLAGPQRIIGVVSQFWLRFRVRRHTYRVEQDGGPSLAVMVARPAERQAVLDALRERRVHDLSSLGTFAAMLTLVRRPRGLVVTASKLQAALLHLIGTRTVTARAASDGTLNLSDWS